MEIMGLFGLTTNENKVLQVLAEKGETTTSDITNLTGISRPNCYDLLNKLIEKGLITCLKKNNKTVYSPNEINSQLMIEEKEKELNTLRKKLRDYNKKIKSLEEN